MVEHPIDSPEMWLDDDVWNSLCARFTVGSTRPVKWPKPDLVTICVSPEFVRHDLLERLLNTVAEFSPGRRHALAGERNAKKAVRLFPRHGMRDA